MRDEALKAVNQNGAPRRSPRWHCVLGLCLCGLLSSGCPWPVISQNTLEPACLEPGWAAEVADAIDVERDSFALILEYLVQQVPLISGDWQGDFGDARFYAPAILLGLGRELDDPCLLALGQASADGNRALLEEGQRSPLSFWLRLPDVVMATHGLVETHSPESPARDRELIDATLDDLNSGLEQFDLYPDVLADSFLSLYGPTTQTAGVAALNLRYALRIGGPRGAERCRFGLAVIDAIDQRAYDPQRDIYRFSSGDDGLYLYPNAMMIVANCLAYEANGDAGYLQRAQTTFENIRALRNPDRGNYRSPYSAERMGATTSDYSTLSSQLYLVTGLALLYECTAQQQYKDEALAVLRFVCTHLRAEGRLLHHWIDGRPARPGDPVYYCSGCNFQALHLMWYLGHLEPRNGAQP
jgi:hypothetical protein